MVFKGLKPSFPYWKVLVVNLMKYTLQEQREKYKAKALARCFGVHSGVSYSVLSGTAIFFFFQCVKQGSIHYEYW